MQPDSFGPFGQHSQAIISRLPIADRFAPDRARLAALFARIGRKRAENKIVADLVCVNDLVSVALDLRREERLMEMIGVLGALREIAGPIGLVPVVAAVAAVEGALETANPHAIGATLSRLERVADRAPLEIWRHCP